MAFNINKKIDDSVWNGKIKLALPGYGAWSLTPINYKELNHEALQYLIHCNDDEIRKYLPSFAAKEIDEAKFKLMSMLILDSKRQSLTLCIRAGRSSVGYIRCLSPDFNDILNNWTIDFWMGRAARRKNIMLNAVFRTLQYLKEHKVELVEAVTSPDNIGAQKILEKCGFNLLDSNLMGEDGSDTVGKLLRYGVRINDLDSY